MIKVQPKRRKFLPQDLKIKTWDDVAPYADNLLNRKIRSVSGFEKFLRDESELTDAVFQEYIDRDIKFSKNSKNKKYEKDYLAFNTIFPQWSALDHEVSKRIMTDPYAKKIKDKYFKIARSTTKTQIGSYAPQNLRLDNKEMILNYKVSKSLSNMTMKYNGKKVLLCEAGGYMDGPNRQERKAGWFAEQDARLARSQDLGNQFGKLVANRNKAAVNTGFDNYVDSVYYNTAAKDQVMIYTPKDMKRFDENVKNIVLPFVEKLDQKRAEKLGLKKLRPWDLKVDIYTQEPIVAFKNTKDLLKKTHKVLNKIDPYFSDVLTLMEEYKHLDIKPRGGKYPGACNYSMPEKIVPYTFGNFSGSVNDAATMIHETGHGVQNILVKDLKLSRYKFPSSDVAEFAAIGMELMSFDHWGEFFDNKADCLRAQRSYLEDIMRKYFPYISQVNKFQREVYEEPDITPKQRNEKYLAISKEYGTPQVDWSGLSKYEAIQWQAKSHPFTSPFYFPEYSFAYIAGANLLKNYRQNPTKTVDKYKKCLALGDMDYIRPTFAKAGVEFDFSAKAIRGAAKFYYGEICKIDKELENEFASEGRQIFVDEWNASPKIKRNASSRLVA